LFCPSATPLLFVIPQQSGGIRFSGKAADPSTLLRDDKTLQDDKVLRDDKQEWMEDSRVQ
jgi:hypothetical protein